MDTHVLLWMINADLRLDERITAFIEDPNNQTTLSIASLWEISIKLGINKLQIGIPFETLARDRVPDYGTSVLAIEIAHLVTLGTLDHHHKDPFDRLIIAQAITENIPILTQDPAFRSYPVTIIP
jgi:PIN domain nuclease of toxin-antitoxin system